MKNGKEENIEVVGIIGARKGSKRLPGKNRLELCGKPLYAYTLEYALAAGIFNNIILTTDDPFILEDSQKYGNTIIDQRPGEYADDNSSMYDVGSYLMKKYPDIFKPDSYICFLNPCYPLRTDLHLREAFDLLEKKRPTSLLGVAAYPFPVNLALDIENQRVTRNWQGIARAGEYKKKYYPAGGFIFVDKEFFIEYNDVYSDNTIAYELDFPFHIDIDEKSDFQMAEALLSLKKAQ
ncbi:MAG: acylneuraminate cytidylyltransferase family protein [bacterium]|nr:acylneuraminate cytidylyltransferase family protein [bacterium]